ncbi:MAG: NADP oxidoreductase [Planctomycetia bacterium]|jgi:NAD-reducing hydrogenase small subunit|nr:NADP oxidoreductase [Planctomycetia bacterium]
MTNSNKKPTVATVWLDGCSGCHMSLMDLDERLIDLAGLVDIVHSPVVDPKEFPASVDLTLVEGAVSSEEDLHKAQIIRARSKMVIALGDCAVTGNVPAMRNCWDRSDLFDRAYIDNAQEPPAPEMRRAALPVVVVPALRPHATPLHEVIKVDLHLPGCPPPADAIWYVLTELLAGRTPVPSEVSRFGK